MKKLCRIVKATAIGVLIWQTIASYYKNDEFKNKLNKSKGFDKFRAIFENLLDVNKKFFTEVSALDYDSKYKEFKSYAEKKYSEINIKVDEIRKNIWDFTQEKVNPILKELSEKANDLKIKAETEITSLSDRLEIERKFDAIKSKIEEIRQKIKK